MENGPFIDDFPIKTSIYRGFSMAMLNNQVVIAQKLGTNGPWNSGVDHDNSPATNWDSDKTRSVESNCWKRSLKLIGDIMIS